MPLGIRFLQNRKIMRRILLFTCCMLLVAGGLNAQSADKIFSEASEAFRQKNYAKSITLYESLVDKNYVSADLFYNLGNAYYRQNKLAQALLWYERALRLNPSDADIRANIAFVNSQTVDQMEVLPEFFLKRWFKAFCSLFSVTGWAVVSIFCCLLFFAGIACFLLAGNLQHRVRIAAASAVACLILVLGISCAFVQKHALERTDEAIVMALSATVKSMPDASGTELFTVHEGMKIRLTDEVGEWVEAVFPNGNKGWLQSRQIAVI